MTTSPSPQPGDENPLEHLDEWDEFLATEVYPAATGKSRSEFRNYDKTARSSVREFYRLNHRYQCHDFVAQKRRQYLGQRRRRMTILQSLEFLNTLVDDSDPDIELDQLQHLLQTSEAIRQDGHEDWFVLTGLLHDLGKILCLFGEPQWAVVGDTFPVGCRFSDKIVYADFFADNPDTQVSHFRTTHGIYEPNCGLRNVTMSWGHDEYLSQLVKDYLPEPAIYMIRYHSFYAWHREGEYDWLCDDHDRRMLRWVQAFNRYDLYSKSPAQPDWSELRPYYERLIDKYLPAELDF